MADVLEGKRGHGRRRSPLGLESGPAGAALATMQGVVVVLVLVVLVVLIVRVLRRRLVILEIVVPLVAPAPAFVVIRVVVVFFFIVSVASSVVGAAEHLGLRLVGGLIGSVSVVPLGRRRPVFRGRPVQRPKIGRSEAHTSEL